MKKIIPILLILAILITILPVSAAGAFYPMYVSQQPFSNVHSLSVNNASQGYAITQVYFTLLTGTNLDFTLQFHDGTTKTGSIDYYQTGLLGTEYTTTITLDGSSDTITGVHIPLSTAKLLLEYSVLNSTEYYLKLTGTTIDIFDVKPTVEIPIDAPIYNPIYGLDVISENNPFDALISFSTMDNLIHTYKAYEAGEENLISFIKKYLTAFYEIVNTVWVIFKFFFIDNLGLLIILIEGGIVAYRISTSKDVFRAISYIITDNERLLRGLIDFISAIASLVWDLINMLNPMRWLRGG